MTYRGMQMQLKARSIDSKRRKKNYLELGFQLNLLFLHSLVLLLQPQIKLQQEHDGNKYHHTVPHTRFLTEKTVHTSLRFSARSVHRKTGPEDGTLVLPVDGFLHGRA
jgi:hypothetical protein